MPDSQPPIPGNNSSFMQDLWRNQIDQAEALSGIKARLETIIEQGRDVRISVNAIGQRLETFSIDMSNLRQRIETLEARPHAMDQKERSTLMETVARQERQIGLTGGRLDSVSRDVVELRDGVAAVRNAPPILTPEELAQVRAGLAFMTKREVSDALNPEEFETVREMVEERLRKKEGVLQMFLTVRTHVFLALITAACSVVVLVWIIPLLQGR